MTEMMSRKVAVAEQLKLIKKQFLLNIVFLIIVIIYFIMGSIMLKIISIFVLAIFIKIITDYTTEIKRLRKKYAE